MTTESNENANRAARIFEKLLQMPMASASDIAALHGLDSSYVHAGLRYLRDMGMAECAAMGFLDSRVERYWVSDRYQEEHGLDGATWHQPGARDRFRQRMSAVEWINRAAAAVRGLGPDPFFQWVDDVAFDAAVKYRDGWVAFIWVGILRSEAGIAERIERLGRDFIALAHGHPQPRPSQVCCVVPDRWQAEMVARVARRYQMEDWIRTWCIADDSWHGAGGYLESTGWVHQPVYRRDFTPRTWHNNLRGSQWSEEANRDPGALLGRVRPAILEALGDKDAGDRLVRRARSAIRKAASPQEAADRLRRFTAGLKDRGEAAGACHILERVATSVDDPGVAADAALLLMAVAEWPGIITSMARAILGEGQSGTRAQWWLVRLADYKLILRWREPKDRRWRCRLTKKGMELLANLDRVTANRVWERIQMDRWDKGTQFKPHEYGLLDIVEKLIIAGCPVAAGWREWHVMGSEGTIDPDALVAFRRTPFGPTQAYFEYERSAVDLGPITRKLGGYDAQRRRSNNSPVLFVCRHEKAEGLFQEVGRQLGIRLLTTTLDRVKESPIVDDPDCWSHYGEKVVIGW